MTSPLFALTTGPSQPEMQGPSAMSNSDFVDPFTGDFSYSVPLFDELGIPLSLNYNSGVTMDQESSWVGLGWSLNPGSISRTVRGLPDDFNGDQVTDDLNIKDNNTFGVSVGPNLELLGISTPLLDDALNLNLYYNNYTGFGIETSLSASLSAGDKASLGLNLNSQSANSFGDIGFSPSVNIGSILQDYRSNNGYSLPLTIGTDFTSTEGLKGLTLGMQTWFGKLGYSVGQLYGNQTYTPKVEHSLLNEAFTFNGKIGLTAFAADANLSISGYGSTQKLTNDDKSLTSQAYGYLYSTNYIEGDILMDFNREKDGSLDENVPNLPLAQLTYDIFSVNAPGMSGTFRAYRNDIGYIKEREASVNSISGAAGAEFAGGLFTSPGIDVAVTYSNSTSKTWLDENMCDDYLTFMSDRPINSLDENVYFAMMGESTDEIDDNFINEFGGSDPVSFKVEDFDLSSTLKNKLVREDESTINLTSDIRRNGRQPRGTSVSYLRIDELDNYYDYANWHTINENAKGHHIGAIIITSQDGTRYIYGLPAYNISQKEINMAVGITNSGEGEVIIDEDNNLVTYSGLQATIGNKSGVDNYYNSVYTPAYAHSFLLTEILSPDFVDVTGNGPSDDDLGTYLKYTYGEDPDEDGVYEPDGIYFWRTPTVSTIMQANYWEGLEQTKTDDKANLVYGSKELWFLNKIETKTHILKFYTSNREDGLGQFINGYTDLTESSRLKRLDKISLFSKPEILREIYIEETDDNAIPIKSAHFVYDYSLCDGIPNSESSGGKLTLKEVYFTYNDSNKGKYSPYTFTYNSSYTDPDDPEIEIPFDYDPTDYDRWGNYKPDSEIRRNKNFPYVSQTGDAILNDFASAWCMTSIILPSGGKIEIEYESDDYAYVQDKQATQMYTISGVKHETSDTEESNLLFEDGDPDETTNLYVYFNIPKPLSGAIYNETTARSYIRSNFIVGENNNPDDPEGVAQNLYFRFKLNTDDNSGAPTEEEKKFEYVSGFATIDLSVLSDYGAVYNAGNDEYDKGYFKLHSGNAKFKPTDGDIFGLELVDYFEEPVHPISKAGWQFAMSNTRYNILDEPVPGDELDAEDIVYMLADISLFTAIQDIFFDPNGLMLNKKIGQEFVPEESFIRLLNPDGQKYGGGCRVRQLLIFDNWEEMTKDSPTDEVYEPMATLGKIYEYKLEDGRSSGVAAYEPGIGGDENPFRIPASYNHKESGYKYEKYLEKPFGESFFPSPVVGYSRIVINDINNEALVRTGTGKTVQEYFTAKDFPVIINATELEPTIHKPGSVILSFFSINVSSSYTGSQGYVIEVNDMHGKPKKTSIFPQGSDIPLSSVEYKYKSDGKLALNETSVMNEFSQVSTEEIGVNYDITIDFRQQKSKTFGGSARYNADGFPVVAFPALITTVWPSVNYSSTSTKIAVITKVVSRNAVLDQVIKFEDGSFIYEKNMVYDAKTGAPLLTSTQNEYEEPYYSFNYPAHWVYDGMGMAFDNDSYEFIASPADIDISNSQILSESLLEILEPGDQLYVHAKYIDLWPVVTNNFDDRYYTAWVYESSEGDYYLINAIGDKIDLTEAENDLDLPIVDGSIDEGNDFSALYGKIYRSGKRNMHSNSVGGFVTKEYPIGTYDTEHELFDLGTILMPEAGDYYVWDEETEEYILKSTQIIASNSSEFSDIWQNFCVENTPPLEDCFYEGDITEEAEDFFTFFSNIIESGELYPNLPGDEDPLLIVDLETEYTYEDNIYFFGITEALLSHWDGFLEEDFEDFDDLDENYMAFMNITDEITHNQQIISIYSAAYQDNICNGNLGGEGVGHPSFFINYGLDLDDDNEWEMGDEFDLTSAEAEWVFSHPEELTYEYIVPDAPLVPGGEIENFKIVFEYTYMYTPKTLIADCGPFTCLNFRSCVMKSLPWEYCMGGVGDNVNPYLHGLKGVWKPKINHMYKTDRYYESLEGLKDDGTFIDYSSFWQLGLNIEETDFIWGKDETDWVWTARAMLKDPFIDEVENKNALEIFSTATFGNNHTLPEMVTNNSTFKNIGFEGFEDDVYLDKYLEKPCVVEHFDFDGTLDSVITHTGNYSLKLLPEASSNYSYALTNHVEERDTYDEPPFLLIAEDCLPQFSPDKVTGMEYLLTFWVKQKEGATPLFTFDDIATIVEVDATSCLGTVAKSEIIEGWQRFEYVITLPDLSLIADEDEIINIAFENTGEENLYIDDIRIQPYSAMAKCYVYDFRTQRLLAELDENHFATLYEYDEEGKLIRVKKETEKGIMTIQESRYFTTKR